MAVGEDDERQQQLLELLDSGDLDVDTFYPPWSATVNQCAHALTEALAGDKALRFIVSRTDAAPKQPRLYIKAVMRKLAGHRVEYVSIRDEDIPGELYVVRPGLLRARQ